MAYAIGSTFPLASMTTTPESFTFLSAATASRLILLESSVSVPSMSTTTARTSPFPGRTPLALLTFPQLAQGSDPLGKSIVLVDRLLALAPDGHMHGIVQALVLLQYLPQDVPDDVLHELRVPVRLHHDHRLVVPLQRSEEHTSELQSR